MGPQGTQALQSSQCRSDSLALDLGTCYPASINVKSVRIMLKWHGIRPSLSRKEKKILQMSQTKTHIKANVSKTKAGTPIDTNGSNDGKSAKSAQLDDDGFCIIEGPETVLDFARLQLQEIQDNIRSRRNAIFLLMEEVRRLRIQQRIKSSDLGSSSEEENETPEFISFIPFLPPLTSRTLRQYYATCFSLMAGIILFGGLVAPMLELKLGLGGTSYKDFINSVHLPLQLSQVDPIVASFSGGAVGVISALMVVEINNVKQQEQKRCKYCLGTGYLACARCYGTGVLASEESTSSGCYYGSMLHSSPERCSYCSGAGKVMCPTCLCTGMAMASEHNPRIDPFD